MELDHGAQHEASLAIVGKKGAPSANLRVKRRLRRDSASDIHFEDEHEQAPQDSHPHAETDSPMSSQNSLVERATKAYTLLSGWCQELRSWPWPGSFESPNSPRLDRDSLDDAGQGTGDSVPADAVAAGHWGCLPASTILAYSSRIARIHAELDQLRFEDLKLAAIEAQRHASELISSPSTWTTPRSPGGFENVALGLLLQALPLHVELLAGLRSWSARLSVLRQLPDFFEKVEAAGDALESAWLSIGVRNGRSPGFRRSRIVSLRGPGLFRDVFENIRAGLEQRMGQVGRIVDMMLDSLADEDDVLPERWTTILDKLHTEYGDWTVDALRKVMQHECKLDTRSVSELYHHWSYTTSASASDMSSNEEGQDIPTSAAGSPVNHHAVPELHTIGEEPTPRPSLDKNVTLNFSRGRGSLSPMSSNVGTEARKQDQLLIASIKEYLHLDDTPENASPALPRQSLLTPSSPLDVPRWEGHENKTVADREGPDSVRFSPVGADSPTTLQENSSSTRRGVKFHRSPVSAGSNSRLPLRSPATPFGVAQGKFEIVDMSSAGSLHKAFSNPALDAERNPRLGLRGYRQTPSPRRPRHPAVPSRANPDSEAAEYSVTHINPRRNHPVTQQIEEQVTRVLATVVDTFHRRSDKPSRASMEAVKSWDSDGTFALAGEAQPALEIRLDPEERSFTSTPNGISKVRTYYLHQGGPEHAAPPMKLFLRLLDDDTVMVRVGGGWAELGEWLRSYTSHHSGASFASPSGANPSSRSPSPSRLTSSSAAGSPIRLLQADSPTLSRYGMFGITQAVARTT